MIMTTHGNIDKIPKNTDYCYEIITVDMSTGRIKTRVCPYWSEQGCSFLGLDTKDSVLLWDQVKECNVNLPDEECYG